MKTSTIIIGALLTIMGSLSKTTAIAQSSRVFNLTWSNDIARQTDYYYTNGMDFSYRFPGQMSKPLGFLFLNAPNHTQEHLNLGISQDIFTPKDLSAGGVIYNDRPYAATLLGNFTRITSNAERGIIVSSTVEFGLIGNNAGGAFFQNGFHGLTEKSDEVKGWDNQIDNGLCLMYQVMYDRRIIANQFTDFSWHTHGSVGTPYTNIGGGIDLKLGNPGNRYAHLGQTDGAFRWYVYAGVDLDVVVYNGTLEGGLIADQSVHTFTEVSPVVGSAHYGINLRYGSLQSEIGFTHKSPEFNTGDSHSWGYVKLSFGL